MQGKGWDDDFASISGLLNCRGIPDTGNSTDSIVRGLENFFELFGEGESKIPRKHLSRFTSMHNRKGGVGLAPRAKAFWHWLQGKGWDDDFASISGLLNCRGIPDTGNSTDSFVRGLENFFELFGEGENKIPRTHLSRFTSMRHGKGVVGLATRAQAFWDWLQGKGWEADFASISGLLNLQGIPDTGNSADPIVRELEDFFELFGEKENKIPRMHLSRFTSMRHGKGVVGLAPRAQAFWGWLHGKGWVDGFAFISGLLHRQGIPDTRNGADPVARELENFFDLFGEGESKIPRKHLCRFTSMHRGKGIPPVNQLLALWTWLDTDSVLLWQAARLFNREGLPSLSTLNSPQNWLKEVTSWDGDDIMSLNTVPLKVIALHLGAPGKKRLTRTRVRSFIEHQKAGGKGAPAVVALARLLCRHGKDGVKAYQEMVDGDSSLDSYDVIKLLQKAASVDLARMAVTEILPQAGFRDASYYLAVCRNIKPAPGLEEWTQIQLYIKTLIRAMTYQDNCSGEDGRSGTVHPLDGAWEIQRLYIDALWTLPSTGRERFLGVRSVQTLLRVVRSITALNQLARANKGDSFQQQCQACLNTATSILTARDLQSLFQIHRTLRIPWYRQQYDSTGDFSNVSTDGSGTGILIRTDSGENGKSLWQPFVAAVVDGLYETDVILVGKETINLPDDQEEMLFSSPRLVLNEQGVRITNWTEEQYRLFGDALELPGFESSSAGEPESFVAGRHDRQLCNPAVENPIDQKNLSPQLIEQLLKSAVSLRAKTWSQPERQRNHLSARILRLLSKKRHLENMPEALRDYVLSGTNSQEQTAADLATTEIAAPDFLIDFEMTGNLVDDLLQQPILKADTLQLLSAYADDLTAAQLTEIITKMDITLPWEVRFPWMSRQANSFQMVTENLDDWSLEDWLGDDALESVTEQEGDELYSPSLVPEWGETEDTDELIQILQ